MLSTKKLRQHIMNAYAFEEIVELILKKVGYSIEEIPKEDTGYDFKCYFDNRVYLFEIKYYSGNIGVRFNLIETSKKLAAYAEKKNHNSEELVIICANNTDDEIKKDIMEKWNIHIVDIGNLLYLVQYDEALNNKLRALLEFSVQDISLDRPSIPANLIDSLSKEISLANEYSDKLIKLKSGKRDFANYENLCIEILKYLFSDYLTLWNKQLKSNSDIYRFDLCCKIKHGKVEEFFDTILNFFNTKYIVFEFKNYKTAITQKEIYTTEKYLYSKALRGVAIIISREGVDHNGMHAIKGCLRENGKLILCLSDEDLLNMLKLKDSSESPADYLSEKLDNLLLKLEK